MTNPFSTTSDPTFIDAVWLRERDASDVDVTIVDVRTPGEFDTAHIPGALNVPLDMVQRHGVKIADAKPSSVVLVCASGQRAQTCEKVLRESGLDDVRVLRGGMSQWQASGGDVERGRERWAMDRQVRLVAGSIVLSSILASVAVPRAKWLAGAIGAGLTFSAVSNTCAMATMLAKLPYNRVDADPSVDLDRLVAHGK